MARSGTSGLVSATTRGRSNAAELALREITAATAREVRRCITRANEQALRLESIASEAVEAIGDVHLDDPPEELSHRAQRLRGVVLNALLVLAEFQLVAGQLDALSSIQSGFAENAD